MRITPYKNLLLQDPRQATEVGSFPEEPTLFLPVTPEMLAHIRGMIHRMSWDVIWEGTEEEIEVAQRTIRQQAWAVALTTEQICGGSDPDFWTMMLFFDEEDCGITMLIGEWGEYPAGSAGLVCARFEDFPSYQAEVHGRMLWEHAAAVETIEIQGWYSAGSSQTNAILEVNDIEVATIDLGTDCDGLLYPFNLSWDVTGEAVWMRNFDVRGKAIGTEWPAHEIRPHVRITRAILTGVGGPPVHPPSTLP